MEFGSGRMEVDLSDVDDHEEEEILKPEPEELIVGKEHAKSHICPQCGKAFSCAGHLRTHEVVHTGARPFSCEICHATFSHSSSMRRHQAKHYEHNGVGKLLEPSVHLPASAPTSGADPGLPPSDNVRM